MTSAVPIATKSLTWPAVACLALILGAFVALIGTGHDASSLVALLGMLGIGTGLAAHTEVRAQQHDAKLDKITEQTNGVLTKRIEAGARAAIRSELGALGYTFPPHD